MEARPSNRHSALLPSDNLKRSLKVARPDTDESLPHIGLVGDTYTILLSGDDTNGRYCLIDMLCAPAGQEEFFAQVGVSVATRTTPPPKPDKEELAEMMKKAQMLAEKYRSELLKP